MYLVKILLYKVYGRVVNTTFLRSK